MAKNNFVKSVGMECEYTQDQIKELMRCKKDPLYFIENYVKIVSIDKGITLFKLYPYQKDVLDHLMHNRYTVSLICRQAGKSVLVSAYGLWMAIFNDNRNIGIASNKEKAAISFLKKLKSMYEQLPVWIKPGAVKWAETSVEFENGSEIKVAATSESSFRGESFSCISGESKICVTRDDGVLLRLPIQEMQHISSYGYKILTRDGFKCFDSVISNGYRYTISLQLSNYERLICTPDHLILKKDGVFIESGKLIVGDVLFNDITVIGISHNGYVEVYDVINVEGTSSFQTNGIEVHNCLILDEFAFAPRSDLFWQSNWPTISSSKTAKVIVISTPNGLFNTFHQLYTGAENGTNAFKHIKFDWTAVPGRDQAWANEQLGVLGKVRFAQEMGVNFIGSSNTVIDSNVLEVLTKRTYPDPIQYDLGNRLRVYEKPVESATYVFGADVAKGTGEHYSTIQVLKLESIKPVKMTQVAVFEDNFTDTYTFADIINRLCYYYNNAYMMVENNGEGSPVIQRLWWEHENPNLICEGTKIAKLGIRATTQSKTRAVLLMKKLIEDDCVHLFDAPTIKQLTDFQDKGNNTFGGVNIDDDLISALYWCVYFLEMNILSESFEFKPNTYDTEEGDGWGILSDSEFSDEDMSWVGRID